MAEWGWDTWLTVGLAALSIGYIIYRKIEMIGLERRSKSLYPARSGAGQAAYAGASPAGSASPKSYETVVLEAEPQPTPHPAIVVIGSLVWLVIQLVRGAIWIVTLPFQGARAQPGVQSLPLDSAEGYERSRDEHGRYANEDWRGEPVQAGAWSNGAGAAAFVAPEPAQDVLALPVKLNPKDPQGNTVAALAVLPTRCPPIPAQPSRYDIPIFFDAAAGKWEIARLAHKDTGYFGIFGLTGGGKGNTIRYLSLSACTIGAEEVVYVAFDSKSGVDYAWTEDVPHAEAYWLGDPEDEEDQAHNLLTGLEVFERIMHRRDKAMRKARVANIYEYNAAVRAGKLPGAEAWPFIVCVVDEVADFPAKAHDIVDSLTRMARAAGFIMVIATQYPTTDALSSQASNNLKNRLVFQTANSRVSYVYLGKTREEGWLYEPTAINRVGVGIWRRIGTDERIGLVPDVNDYQAGLLAKAQEAGRSWTRGSLAKALLAQAERSAKAADQARGAAPEELLANELGLAGGSIGTGAEEPAQEAQPGDPDQAWRVASLKYDKLITDDKVQAALRVFAEREATGARPVGVKELARLLYAQDTSDYFYAAQAIHRRVSYLLSSGMVQLAA